MTETIGKITLNLDKYPGEDYYCDGSVEEEILDIVKKYSTVEYDRISFLYRKQRKCWKWAADAEPSRVHWQEKPGK